MVKLPLRLHETLMAVLNLKKCEVWDNFSRSMADEIIGMYAFGTSTREIDRFAIQTIYVPADSIEKYETAEG